MTTLVQEDLKTLIRSEDQLAHYFDAFVKTREKTKVGLEAEFLGVHSQTGKALPYSGGSGIEAILKRLVDRFEYTPLWEGEHIIALNKGDSWIGLEPGGQIELSAPPVTSIFEVHDQLQNFISQLREISIEMPEVAWLAFGIHPFSSLEEISTVPKKRYEVMEEYFKGHGTLSHHMMKLTATNQVNVDYLSEEDALANFRVALGITSIVTAMFANSSFSDGKPNGFHTKRLHIWNHTDPTRTGLLLQFLQPGRTFQDYLDYLLDIPVIFMIRDEKWVPVQRRTFRQFIHQGYSGTQATLSDFDLHLSTAFPEVRLKHYLEIRGVDGQSPDLIPAVAAFWKGILYNPDAREAAWKEVAFASPSQRLQLHFDVERKGLKARFGKRSVLDYARDLVEISCQSLALQNQQDESRNECRFLQQIREKITRPGRSPAETLLEKWHNEMNHHPMRLIEYLKMV